MINSATTWYEIAKLGNISKVVKDSKAFYRGNILRVLANEGWLEYLKEPHTEDEIAEHFNYAERDYLMTIITAFIMDGTLEIKSGGKYAFKQPVDTKLVIPSVFNDQLKDLWWNFADFIPKRLRGEKYVFTGGLNLYNWDNALSNKMYRQIRKAAFAYVRNFKNRSNFLDIGSGTGFGTTSIWLHFQNNKNTENIKVAGVEPEADFIEIAKNEFERMARKISGKPLEEIQKRKDIYPEFKIGTITEIPYEDEHFDYVYASQVIHWSDPEKAIKEMLRVTKPGGIIFGTQLLDVKAHIFADIHIKVMKGANGIFTKDDMEKWAKNAGARKVKFSTPLTIFKITK